VTGIETVKTTRKTLVACIALASLGQMEAVAQTQADAQGRVGRVYMYFALGAFDPDSDAQLRNPSGQYAFVFGGGFRQSRYFAWEIEFLGFEQRFDTPASVGPPLFGTISGRSTLATEGFAGTAKLLYPSGRVEPYAGAGIGIYRTTLTITGQQFGFPAELSEDSVDPAIHVVAGLDLHLSERSTLTIEGRKLWLDAGFSPVLTGTVKVGGAMLLAAYRFRF
jgi:opacity protein-like surface antigen